MISGHIFCLAWIVCFGVCMLPYSSGIPPYAGNCLKHNDNCTGQTFCGAPGNCANTICEYKCYNCYCTNRTQCYFMNGNQIGCNCTGFGTTGSLCESDIDECKSSPCMNGGTCCNGVNRYTCVCPAGYTGPRCDTNINECLPNPCLNGGNCTDGLNNFTCTCATGYRGATCQINVDDCATHPCQNGGICIDGVNSYTCNCDFGFSGVNCEIDINECPGFTSTCPTGYSCVNIFGGYCCSG